MEDFERFLRAVLNDHLDSKEGFKKNGSSPLHLSDSIQYSLLAPGRRIRPRLLLKCAEMLGFSAQDVFPAAAAIEMIHCFTLIHDDLPCMDNDDFRRGQPSNHKKFGESTALLAGDALIALAVEVFLESKVDFQFLKTGLKRLTWAMGPRGVIGGQAAESLLGKASGIDELIQMHRQKTGALFSAAILIPKDFAGISDESTEGVILHRFADALGLAFQVADDLEDDGETSIAPSTSILSHLSRTEAGTAARNRLGSATEQVCQQWGSHAGFLNEISDEVIQKIKKAGGIPSS